MKRVETELSEEQVVDDVDNDDDDDDDVDDADGQR